MNLKHVLLTTVSFLCCFYAHSKQGTCLIKQDGILVEKRYVDNNKKINCVISYNNKVPVDSVIFSYEKMMIKSVKTYSYTQGHYEPNELMSAGDYYLQLFEKDETCKISKLITQQFLLEDILSNLCTIHGSTLTSGKDVSSLAIITKEKDNISIAYNKINSRFNTLPEVFQSYFPNEILKSLNLKIQNGFLQTEKYTFSTGTLTRTFVYKNAILNKVVLEVRYNKGKTINSVKSYEFDSN